MEKLEVLKQKTKEDLMIMVEEHIHSDGRKRTYKLLSADEIEFLKANKDKNPWSKLNVVINNYRESGCEMSIQHMVKQTCLLGIYKSKKKESNFVSREVPSEFFNYREVNRYYKI